MRPPLFLIFSPEATDGKERDTAREGKRHLEFLECM
jgi:hypothetical protein